MTWRPTPWSLCSGVAASTSPASPGAVCCASMKASGSARAPSGSSGGTRASLQCTAPVTLQSSQPGSLRRSPSATTRPSGTSTPTPSTLWPQPPWAAPGQGTWTSGVRLTKSWRSPAAYSGTSPITRRPPTSSGALSTARRSRADPGSRRAAPKGPGLAFPGLPAVRHCRRVCCLCGVGAVWCGTSPTPLADAWRTCAFPCFAHALTGRRRMVP
mmetsp:Transcript_19824/g.62840  ORF Transcript_19824/g.62840 Transcript_19824/m.62840 type:complete len:214 (+) Transcript_19824:1571-2212(+)